MDVLVISGGSQTRDVETEVDCESVDETSLEALVEDHPEDAITAEELYSGREHQHVHNGVGALETVADVDWRILSAGFGLVAPGTEVLPTDCTFNDIDALRSRAATFGYSPGELTHAGVRRAVGEALHVQQDLGDQLETGYDLVFVILSSNALEVVEPGLGDIPDETTAIAIAAEGAADWIGACHWLPATDTERALLKSDWVTLRGALFEGLVSGLEDEADLQVIETDPGLAYFRSLGVA